MRVPWSELCGTISQPRVVCLDDLGLSQFNELLFQRGTPRFCAFDILHLDNKDLCEHVLIERKRILRRVVPRHSGDTRPQAPRRSDGPPAPVLPLLFLENK